MVSLLDGSGRSCLEARDIAQRHLDDVRSKVEELRELEESLGVLLRDCDASCAGGPGPDCVILDDLSQPVNARKGCCS